MLAYPIELTEDGDTVMVTCPDLPEVSTFGEDTEDAIARATDAIEEAIAARIARRDAIPAPSQGQIRATLPTLTAAKVLLHQNMQAQGVSKAELARRLGWHLPQVDRVLDINHHSRLDRIDAALGAFGCRLEVKISQTA